MRLIFDEFADFVAAHYALSQRQDSQYWRDNFNKDYDVEELDGKYGLKLYGREFLDLVHINAQIKVFITLRMV